MKPSVQTAIRVTPLALFVATFALYVSTLAPSVVPGDPGEYQFIPHILGIAHPPGYAFFTLLAKLWTTLVRVGSIAYRGNLLAAAAGAWTVTIAYGIVTLLAGRGAASRAPDPSSDPGPLPPSPGLPTASPAPSGFEGSRFARFVRVVPALFAALALATSTDLWQHSIHANAHIVSAALSATTLYAGLRWWATGRDRWLYTFAFLAALGVTHHPLLAFGAPAYALFALAVRPRLLRDWRRLARLLLAILAGLAVFLYLPLRAGATPFGPSPNLDAILGHATARGIRGNLFYYGLADQPVRLRVFWELLRLQFAPLTLALAGLGLVWLAWRRRRPFILLALFYSVTVAFIINTVQDVMAYLLLPFATTAVLSGAGLLALLREGPRLLRHPMVTRLPQAARRRGPHLLAAVLALLALLLVIGPVASARHNAPRLSLRDYRLADAYIDAVFDQFAGKGEGAILLAPWEGITPLHYAEQAAGRRLDPNDVRPVFVASGTANPWVEFVWRYIEEGPIYLADYRPAVVAEGFRLRPVGDLPLYKLEPPPATRLPEIPHPVDLWAGDAIHLLGWGLDRTTLRVGETANLTLYMTSPQELTDYYMPYLLLGDRAYRWTTDSRLNTPWWLPDEIVVERYPITIPFGTPPGSYPLALGVSNVSQGHDLTLSSGAATWPLPVTLDVFPAPIAPPDDVLANALANLNSQIALVGGSATARGQAVHAPWSEPLLVYPGDQISVWLDWRALATVDDAYTVFVHLIDGGGYPWAQHDYTPLGGAFPTFLWIPRWIEGQQVSDPYQLSLPPDIPPGDYLLEAGMYGMTSLRRVYHFDAAGNLAGDRYVLGPARVVAP